MDFEKSRFIFKLYLLYKNAARQLLPSNRNGPCPYWITSRFHIIRGVKEDGKNLFLRLLGILGLVDKAHQAGFNGIDGLRGFK